MLLLLRNVICPLRYTFTDHLVKRQASVVIAAADVTVVVTVAVFVAIVVVVVVPVVDIIYVVKMLLSGDKHLLFQLKWKLLLLRTVI